MFIYIIIACKNINENCKQPTTTLHERICLVTMCGPMNNSIPPTSHCQNDEFTKNKCVRLVLEL